MGIKSTDNAQNEQSWGTFYHDGLFRVVKGPGGTGYETIHDIVDSNGDDIPDGVVVKKEKPGKYDFKNTVIKNYNHSCVDGYVAYKEPGFKFDLNRQNSLGTICTHKRGIPHSILTRATPILKEAAESRQGIIDALKAVSPDSGNFEGTARQTIDLKALGISIKFNDGYFVVTGSDKFTHTFSYDDPSSKNIESVQSLFERYSKARISLAKKLLSEFERELNTNTGKITYEVDEQYGVVNINMESVDESHGNYSIAATSDLSGNLSSLRVFLAGELVIKKQFTIEEQYQSAEVKGLQSEISAVEGSLKTWLSKATD